VDTIINEILAGAFIFAAANIVFFEVRSFLRTYLNKFKSLQDPQDFEGSEPPNDIQKSK
jgi:hypothetical protein